MVQRCNHCQSPIGDVHAPAGYCCVGCASVAALLKAQELTRFYDLTGGASSPVQLPSRKADLAWLDAPLAKARELSSGDGASLELDIQGIRCSACVWLIQELFMREPGALDAVVNPGLGRVRLSFRANTRVATYVAALENYGYRAGPPTKDPVTASDGVLLRLGICAALTINSMMFSLAHYLGLSPEDPQNFALMRGLNLALSVLVLWVGGSEFFARTLFALRRGVIPFDLPIALGLSLAFGGSLVVFWRQPNTLSYFDTLNTFTTLMLVGRWLQERVLEQNRRQLLNHDGVEGLYARRVNGARVETVPAHRVMAGDELLLPSGGLLVVEAVLLEDSASCSLDWVNGESVPRAFTLGTQVPAGAFNAGLQALRVRAAVDFAQSSLVALLAQDPDAVPASGGTQDDPVMLQRFTRLYVPFVLLSAVTAFAVGMLANLDRAIAQATAVLVVTCPCALGLAIPLAYQRVTAAMRVRGLFVRKGGFWDRAVNVKRVVFDKTGTLTMGHLTLNNPEVFGKLPAGMGAVVYNLTARSTHPASLCIHAAVPFTQTVFNPSLQVKEVPGSGLETRLANGMLVRLGSARFTGAQASSSGSHDTYLSAGEFQACFSLEETLRWDAAAQVARLLEKGHTVTVLSGDQPVRVAATALQLGLEPSHAVGGLSPQGKADWLRAHRGPQEAMLIGDGVNDHPGFDAALCSGTPAVEHPVLSSQADFYFLTPGVGVVGDVLSAAHHLRRTVKSIRALALGYNALAVTACILGWVSPLLAAVAMPASSVLILLYAVKGTRLEPAQPLASTLGAPGPIRSPQVGAP